MAMAKSGYTLHVIKAGQQGRVEMRWGHLAEVDTRAAAATIAQHIGLSLIHIYGDENRLGR